MDLTEMIRENVVDEIKGRDDYRKLANHLRKGGYYSEGNLVDAMADDEDRHANLLMSIINSIKEKAASPKWRERIARGEIWEVRYYWTAIHKGSGEIAEETTPHRTIEKALRDAKHFVRSSWRFPGEVLIEVWDKPHKYSESLIVEPLASEYLYIPDKYITSEELERSGVIVTVTNAGDTSWSIGDTIAAEEFDIENKKMLSLGRRPALGEYHY